MAYENTGYYRILKALGVESEQSGAHFADDFARGGKASVSGTRMNCVIDESWVDTVEAALPSVGKAIEQARSLIRDIGEVVRIDRARKTGKDSVSHLARHSSLIRHVSESGALIPDEIYVNENEEDYAVYENRFLYLLLTQLSSFISVRYQAITRAVAECGVALELERETNGSDRSVKCGVSVSEAAFTGAAADIKTLDTVRRIRALLAAVKAFESTPVMRLAAAAPRLVPPVVRTNIIKNNVHFNAAFTLYSYIASYTGDGYTCVRETQTERPVSWQGMRMFAEAVSLLLFAAYKETFSEWDECESEYERSLVDERRESLLRRREELAALRARYEMNELSGSEYVSRLEEAAAESYSAFESTSSELASVRETARLAEEKSASLSAENERITERFLAQKEESAAAANAVVEKLAKEYERRISEAAAAKEREMSELREKLESERDLLSARVAALCAEKGEGSDKTDRESFLELEREKAAFDRYFKEQWAKAKKRVRREEYAKRKNGK